MGGEVLRPPVLCFVGRKNSGKTTLMEKVIAGLTAGGDPAAAAKHAAPRFENDRPGKDSYRFSAAGADTTVISSPEKTAVDLHHREEIPLEAILSRFVEGVDIILAEGYKASRFPKIEVHREATGEPLLDPPPPGLIAVATDERVDSPAPQFDVHDPDAVVRFIKTVFLGGA